MHTLKILHFIIKTFYLVTLHNLPLFNSYFFICKVTIPSRPQGYWVIRIKWNNALVNIFFYCCARCNTTWHLQNFLNIYLNSCPLSFSCILSSPHSWNSFNRSHFSIYTHVYTVFAPYSPSHTLFPPLPPFHWY
jgi:hypothetical protein